MSAIKFFGENHLNLSNIVAARLGRGLKELPAARGYASSIVVIWRPGGTYNQFLEPVTDSPSAIGRVRFNERPDWNQLRVLQLLMSSDTTAVAEAGENRTTESAQNDGGSDRLSTIPEGSLESEPSDDSLSSAGSYLKIDNEGFQAELDKVADLLEIPLPTEMHEAKHDDQSDRMPLSLLCANIDAVTLAEPLNEIDQEFVELAVYPPMSNTLSVVPRQLEPGEIVLLQVGPNTMRQEVVKRDDDILTPAQLKECWPEVRPCSRSFRLGRN